MTLEHFYQNLEGWWPKVKSGGFFCGHDYSAGWPEVVKAVNEFAQTNKLTIFAQELSWITQKP